MYNYGETSQCHQCSELAPVGVTTCRSLYMLHILLGLVQSFCSTTHFGYLILQYP